MSERSQRDPYGFVGSILAERYEIQELLGMGGMAVVYRAKHLITTRTVAVKILKPDQVYANPKIAEYFLNEAKATANLNHRNIVAVSDADNDADGTAFLVMEYLKGKTLDEELKMQEYMPLDRIATLFEQICDGVDHAHSNQILHRDLKPGNIMIAKDDRGDEQVKILDFGIAKAMTATAPANVSQTIGTFSYASPEQLNKGASIDHRSDVYSLGVILYQMLTGAFPFEEDSYEHIIYQKMNFVLPSTQQIRPEISMEVEDVIRRALAREPERRFQNAPEMARALWRGINLQTGVLAVECEDIATHNPMTGASIILNGRYSGQTNARGEWSLAGLSPKQYLVEVESPGYSKWRVQVRVEPNEEAIVSVALEREPKGELIVRTNVRGTLVIIDGRRAGETNDEKILHLDAVEAGKHRVRLAHPKYEPAEAEVVITTGEITPFAHELRPKLTGGWKKGVAAATALFGILMVVYVIYDLIGLNRSNHRISQSISASSVSVITPSPDPTETPVSSPDSSPSPSSTPMSPEEEIGLANRLLAQNNYQRAVEHFELAKSLRSGDSRVISGLNQAYPRLADQYLSRKQWGAAAATCQKAIRLNSNDATLHDRLGDAYNGQRNYARAANEYDEAIRLGLNDANVNYKSGLAYFNQGKIVESIARCSKATSLNRKLREAYIIIGAAQEKQNKHDEALKAYKTARDMNRSDAQVWYEIGRIYVKKRDRKEAGNYVKELTKLNSPLARRLASEIVAMR